jgi:hypothetical protein
VVWKCAVCCPFSYQLTIHASWSFQVPFPKASAELVIPCGTHFTQVSPCDARVPYCRRRLQTHQYPCRRHHVVWKCGSRVHEHHMAILVCFAINKAEPYAFSFFIPTDDPGNGSPAEAWAWNSGDDNTKKWVPQGITSSADAFEVPFPKASAELVIPCGTHFFVLSSPEFQAHASAG